MAPEITLPTVINTQFYARDAVAADGTTPLSILARVGHNDPYTNYIKAYATTDGQGAVQYTNRVTRGFGQGVTAVKRVLKLSDVTGNSQDDVDGVYANRVHFPFNDGRFRFNHEEDAVDLKARHYAGLFATTNLGAPLTDGSVDGIWNARFAIVVSSPVPGRITPTTINGGSGARQAYVQQRVGQTDFDNDTTMMVDFQNKRITTRTQDPVNFRSYGGVIIDGYFTPEGVIYGDSSWVFRGETSHGSVSGLIGSQGAVGAFISNGANNLTSDSDRTNGEYSGGFVAAPR